MGTRGLMAFTSGGELKGAYNHWDSYPSGLGAVIAKWLINTDLAEARTKFEALEVVSEDAEPTPEQVVRLLQYANLNVSTQSPGEWYVLLRETQGDPQATLDSGFIFDSLDFAADSLFCEWGYVVDLDTGALEVYKGFQTEPHTDGRFAGLETEAGEKYGPIRLVRTFNLQELQESPDALSEFEGDE